MKKLRYKFYSKPGTTYHIIPVFYDERKSYHDLLASQQSIGNRQIIINSEIMIGLLKLFVFDTNLKISKIEFMEHDDLLSETITYMVKRINEGDRGAIAALNEQLAIISEKESIDIKSIDLNGYLNSIPAQISIQSNGIVSLNEEIIDVGLSLIQNFIEDYFKE